MIARCIKCGSEYERPEKTRASYCKDCCNEIKKPSQINFGPLGIKNCYDYKPTRRG